MEARQFCKHGWSVAFLNNRLAEAGRTLAECRVSVHPMRSAMVEGEERQIQTLRAHLAEAETPRTKFWIQLRGHADAHLNWGGGP